MKYLAAMVLSFVSGMYQLTVAAELAADAGQSVLTWLAVAVIGLILFFQAVTMALVSVMEERAEQLLEERGDLNSVTISAGKAIINGKLYDIPAQTVTPEEFEAIR